MPGVEQLVLDADDARAGAAQHPAAYDVVRLRGGGLVEHRGSGGPPVDQQGVAVLVTQADPTDVPRRGVELGAHVETAEDQPLVRGVELGDPLGGLEDHRVALDQPALVTEAAALVTLTRQLLGGRGRLLQLDVDPVDEGLFGRDLTRGNDIGQGGATPWVMRLRQGENFTGPRGQDGKERPVPIST